MSTNNMFKAVLCVAVVAAAIRQEEGGATSSEEAIRDEHGAVVAGVPRSAYYFGADNQSVAIPVCSEHVTCQVQGYNPGTTTHPAEICT